jgi:hypothetical protein
MNAEVKTVHPYLTLTQLITVYDDYDDETVEISNHVANLRPFFKKQLPERLWGPPSLLSNG